MLRLLLLVTMSFFTLASYGQKSIEQYKKSVDSFMAIHLDMSVLKDLKCYSYMATLKNQNSVSYAGDYDKEKDKVLANVGMIGFFFDYYCPKLKYTFHWYLNLNEDGRILPVHMLSKTFPVCIQKGQPCNLITRDSAVKIAQADSMKFADNYMSIF